MVARQEVTKAQNPIRLEPVRYDTETLNRWETWINDPDIRKWMYSDGIVSRNDIQDALYNATHDAKRHYFTIAADGKPLGFISLRQDQIPSDTGEIGIVIGEKSYQSRGIGTQALDTMVEYAKNSLHLSGIRAMIKPENEKSIRLFTRAGFVRGRDVTVDGVHMVRFDKQLHQESETLTKGRTYLDTIGLVRLSTKELGTGALQFAGELLSGGKTKDARASILMIPTGLTAPDPEILAAMRGASILAVEFGGTNMRVARGTIGPDGQPALVHDGTAPAKLEGTLSKLQFESPGELFDELFRLIDAHPNTLPKNPPDALGLIWSFPGEARRTGYGVDVLGIEKLTKGITVQGLEGVPVGQAFREAFMRRYYPASASRRLPVAVVNDTPAVLFSHTPPPETKNSIGLVDGTGFNIAVNHEGHVYNLEAGRFDGFPLPSYAQDTSSAKKYPAEYMSSGKYVGEQFDEIVGLLLKNGHIQGHKTAPLTARDVDAVLNADRSGLSEKLGHPLSVDEYSLLADAAIRLRDRAGLVVGTMIGTVIRAFPDGFSDEVMIPAEGSFFAKLPGLTEVSTVIATAVAGKPVTFRTGKDLGILGAIAAAATVN